MVPLPRVLDLIMALEDKYDIEIDETDPELAEVSTVIELSELVDRRIAGQ
jgi:acyl carrier protein